MYVEVIASQRWRIFKHSVLVVLPTDNDIRPSNCYYYYYIRLTAFFQDNLGKSAPES